MTGTRVDPYAGFNFTVVIDGITKAGFSECTGLDASIDVIEYREGADAVDTVRKLPGLTRYAPLVLTHGLTQDRSLWTWFSKATKGTLQRATIVITLFDAAHQAPVASWTAQNAWPSKWIGPRFNAKASEVALEMLVIEHEGFDIKDTST